MPKTIIAIEDDPQIADLIGLVLASEEVQVQHFSSGDAGLAAVQAVKPDLVLLDIMIPDFNGWEVYDHIRHHDDIKNTPVIILSVMQQPFQRRVVFSQSRIDFYITKPFDILSLRERINGLLHVSTWQVPDKFPEPRIAPLAVMTPIREKLNWLDEKKSPPQTKPR